MRFLQCLAFQGAWEASVSLSLDVQDPSTAYLKSDRYKFNKLHFVPQYNSCTTSTNCILYHKFLQPYWLLTFKVLDILRSFYLFWNLQDLLLHSISTINSISCPVVIAPSTGVLLRSTIITELIIAHRRHAAGYLQDLMCSSEHDMSRACIAW